MNSGSTITRDDYEDFLVYLYFGAPDDWIEGCMVRAYRDFNRTLHGIGLHPKRAEYYPQAKQVLAQRLELLRNAASQPKTIGEFDAWHEQSCSALIKAYDGYPFYIGQAQKWINMTLKYIFTLGEKRVSSFGEIYRFCHIPIDLVILGEFASKNPPIFEENWSRINNYQKYLCYQNWVRENSEEPPLDQEFRLWLTKQSNIKPKTDSEQK